MEKQGSKRQLFALPTCITGVTPTKIQPLMRKRFTLLPYLTEKGMLYQTTIFPMLQMVTPRQAAEKYGLSIESLAKLRKKGMGARYYYRGQRIYYFCEDLEAWLQRDIRQKKDSLPE